MPRTITIKDLVDGRLPEELEGDDHFGNHLITNEEARIHTRKIKESEGFDVDEIPKCYYCGLRRLSDPVVKHNMKDFRRYCVVALNHYNATQNANLELVEVLKVNMDREYDIQYYMTFTAKDKDSSSGTYQAKVEVPFFEKSDRVTVLLCRPRPSSSFSSRS